jgi:aryl-alcohol dehydrogenase-like predicted oxidoreductase
MNKQGLASEQSLYNLSNRMLELEVIPACRRFGMGLMIYSPLACGLLGGALAKHAEGRRSSEQFKTTLNQRRDQIEAYEKRVFR